mmetsp:Transcript_22570/g.61472  ORF Transcript_22570/g.61472 Transcript_22570/m.61472 type:complete len:188 (-) Transcript_22570:85-648(-)
MALTVDSVMNSAGYVHAYGFKDGVEYAGYVKLTTPNYPAYSAPPQMPVQVPSAPAPAHQVLSLKVSRDGTATINGEPVVAANSRTASIIRLLAKKSVRASDRRKSALDAEIAQTKSILSKLERAKLHGADDTSSNSRGRHQYHGDSRRSVYSAIKALMKSVSRIEEKEDKMSKVVDKVKKIMRYKPF